MAGIRPTITEDEKSAQISGGLGQTGGQLKVEPSTFDVARYILRLRNAASRQFGQEELLDAEWHVILALHAYDDCPPAKLSTIAERAGVNRITGARCLRELERSGYVVFMQSGRDKRITRAELTRMGRLAIRRSFRAAGVLRA